MSDEQEFQWRVTWFPPGKHAVVRTSTEQVIRRIAEAQSEWRPIIERRAFGPWETEKS